MLIDLRIIFQTSVETIIIIVVVVVASAPNIDNKITEPRRQFSNHLYGTCEGDQIMITGIKLPLTSAPSVLIVWECTLQQATVHASNA